MHLNLPQPEIWERVNDEIQSALKVSAPVRVRCFRDMSSALFEIAQGTAQFLSHKKSVGFITGQAPAFEFLLPFFYKEAFNVQKLNHLQASALQTWVNDLKKDTTFVVYCEDHPITGEVFAFCDDLDQMLNDKKIFSIRISHANHYHRAIEIKPFTIRICDYGNELAIALCGDRFRSPPVVAPWQYWDKQDTLQKLALQSSRNKEQRKLIVAFESEASIAGYAWFKNGEGRVYDRALVSFPDVSAEAVRAKILSALGKEKAATEVMTTNLCFHNSVGLYEQWWEPRPSSDALRGLLLIDPALLSAKDFAKVVISAYEEIKSLQSWTA